MELKLFVPCKSSVLVKWICISKTSFKTKNLTKKPCDIHIRIEKRICVHIYNSHVNWVVIFKKQSFISIFISKLKDMISEENM